MNDRLHEMLIERANAGSRKRISDKQKRFGTLHDTDEELVERAIVDAKNRDALVGLMLRYALTIPAREFPQWRPTERVKADILGVFDSVELIATNGVLGWFINDETSQPVCAHIQCFTGDVKPLFHLSRQPKPSLRKKRTKTRRQQIIDSM